MSSIHEKLASSELTEQSYNYAAHTKEIDGGGLYFGATGRRQTAAADVRSKAILEEDVHEVERQLESIALNAACMDDDVAQAMFGDFEEGDFEEILDDFCVTAAESPEGSDEEGEDGGFDYDEHIRRLMERAEKEQEREEDDFFQGRQQLTTDEEIEANRIVTPEEKLVMEQKFAETLLEYDSDGVGDLDEECDDIQGFRPLEGDALLDAALDDFLRDEKDQFFMHGSTTNGYKALVGTELVLPKRLQGDVQEEHRPVEEVMKEADRILANPEMEPPDETVLIDGKSYFSEKIVNPWDVESILTTYSNLDNNPTTIGRTKKKKNKEIILEGDLEWDEESYHRIELSNKTGLPLGVLPGIEKAPRDEDAVNLGLVRNKDETKEEKKARKQAVKESRQEARTQKRIMKDAFNDEFARRSAGATVDDVGGRPVFRYT